MRIRIQIAKIMRIRIRNFGFFHFVLLFMHLRAFLYSVLVQILQHGSLTVFFLVSYRHMVFAKSSLSLVVTLFGSGSILLLHYQRLKFTVLNLNLLREKKSCLYLSESLLMNFRL
jgi:hypothetical protein